MTLSDLYRPLWLPIAYIGAKAIPQPPAITLLGNAWPAINYSIEYTYECIARRAKAY
jgi:hypothetical protein